MSYSFYEFATNKSLFTEKSSNPNKSNLVFVFHTFTLHYDCYDKHEECRRRVRDKLDISCECLSLFLGDSNRMYNKRKDVLNDKVQYRQSPLNRQYIDQH